MHTKGRKDLAPLSSEPGQGREAIGVDCRNHKACDTGTSCTSDDGVAVRIETGIIQVAVGVQHDAILGQSEPIGKGELRSPLHILPVWDLHPRRRSRTRNTRGGLRLAGKIGGRSVSVGLRLEELLREVGVPVGYEVAQKGGSKSGG